MSIILQRTITFNQKINCLIVVLSTFLQFYYIVILLKKCTMQSARQRTLYFEIFTTIKNLNPRLMHSIFSSRTLKNPPQNPSNFNHFRPNQVNFGSKSLNAMGSQIWNCLPNEMKSADNLNSFKCMIKRWDGPSCKCNVCKYNGTDTL